MGFPMQTIGAQDSWKPLKFSDTFPQTRQRMLWQGCLHDEVAREGKRAVKRMT
jgi:hypothetical protein